MSKRRLQSDEDDEQAPESLTPEERRAKRRRERAQQQSGKGRRGLGSPLRRGLLLGVVALVLVGILFLVVANPFKIGSPCLSLNPAPYAPWYPNASTADLGNTWCPPPGTAVSYVVQPKLTIVINGTTVGIPAGLGMNRTPSGQPCNLPITTPTTPGALPSGVFTISSDWPYSYNLSWFFEEWQATFGTVGVGPTHPNQPVVYTSGDLLGFTTDAKHAIHLTVDGSPSSAGPGLVISTLANQPQTFPSCVATTYGTGHTILLTYSSTSAGALAPGSAPEPAVTGTAALPPGGPPATPSGASVGIHSVAAIGGPGALGLLQLRPGRRGRPG